MYPPHFTAAVVAGHLRAKANFFATTVRPRASHLKGLDRTAFEPFGTQLFAVTSKPDGCTVRSFSRPSTVHNLPQTEPSGKRIQQERVIDLKHLLGSSFVVLGLALSGCQKGAAPPAAAGGGGMHAMPVQTVAVSLAPVPQSSEYVATVRSRRSANLQPQVDGQL